MHKVLHLHALTGTREAPMTPANKTTWIGPGGKLTISHEIREQLALGPGDKGWFVLREAGTLTLHFEKKPPRSDSSRIPLIAGDPTSGLVSPSSK
jgi:hypothetical protein